MITNEAIHPLGKYGKLVLKLGKQKQVLCLHLAFYEGQESYLEQFMQTCSKWEGRLEPGNMRETGLFLNTLLEQASSS